MPSTDFWETLKTAIETAFERVANRGDQDDERE